MNSEENRKFNPKISNFLPQKFQIMILTVFFPQFDTQQKTENRLSETWTRDLTQISKPDWLDLKHLVHLNWKLFVQKIYYTTYYYFTIYIYPFDIYKI